MAERAGENFRRRQDHVGAHPEQGDPGAAIADCRPECSL